MIFLTNDERRVMTILWRHDPAFLMDCQGQTLDNLIALGLAYVVKRMYTEGESFVFLTEAGLEALKSSTAACTTSSSTPPQRAKAGSL